jgi:hypothetical protein
MRFSSIARFLKQPPSPLFYVLSGLGSKKLLLIERKVVFGYSRGMLTNRRILSLGAILAVTATLAGATPALAAEDSCNFSDKFADLRGVQADTDRDYISAIRAELDIRKSILKGVIDCALEDVKDRKDKLQGIAPAFDNSTVKTNISQALDESAEYYNQQKEAVDSLGIKGTKDVARDIASFREGTFNPAAEREDDLLLWTANQPLFSKTASRFSEIRPIVLSLSLINRKEINEKFNEAEEVFKEAQENNEAAKMALLSQDMKASDLIKASLQPLSSIYKKFLEISDSLNKIVP